MTDGPYARAAWAYRDAGWAGVIPLPPGAKWPPPSGYTGWAGVDPSGADVQAWCDGPEGAGNIALRLPPGVYGLDVDAYAGKRGGEALAGAEANLGALPDTWVVTSRDDGVSGIRLYRAQLAPGHRWRDEPAGHGAGIEAIHFGHRYALTWPSVHPDTGATYVWHKPAGASLALWSPHVDDLPELPAAWIEALSEPGEVATGETAPHAQTLAAVHAWPDRGAPCAAVREARERALARLREAGDGAALHPAGRDATKELTALGHEGHPGARAALAEHFGAFVPVRVARGDTQAEAEAEWWRMVRGAVGKLVGAPRQECDCALMAGEGVQFDPGSERESEPGSDSRSGDDASGGEGGVGGVSAPDPVETMTAELMTSAQVAEQPNPVALIGGLLYMDTLAWLIGKSGSFKSFVALDMAQHVAAGKPWADRRARHGQVLYVVAEGAGGMGKRMRAWIMRNGEPSEHARFLRRPVQANSAEWAVLIEVARRITPALIVIDTQARVTVGIKENDNTEMGMFIQRVDSLRRATGACVLLVHHIGRSGDDARGASAIDGAQDTELKVERTGGPKSMTARLTTDKQKDGPDTESVDFEMLPVDLGVDPETGDPLSSLVVNTAVFVSAHGRPWEDDLPGKLVRILEVLHDQFSECGGTRSEVLAVLREKSWSKDYPRSTFYRVWNELIKLKKIEQIPGSQRWEVMPDDL